MSTVQEQIVGLKRQAIALKESGDVNGAMALLAQARDLEFENATVEDLCDPLKLKQFAVVMKKRGDLDAARQALLKAKQIEEGDSSSGPQEQGQIPRQSEQPPAQPLEPARKPTKALAGAIKQPDPPAEPSLPSETADQREEESEEEEEEGELQALLQVDHATNDDNDPNTTTVDVSYTIEEMMEQELLIEFKQEGMPVPSDEEYHAKILECKKAALAAKQAGDTPRALQELQKSKRLEAVRAALSQVAGGAHTTSDNSGDDWMANLNAEESELLGELMMDNNNPHNGSRTSEVNANNGSNNNNTADGSDSLEAALEELADFMEDPALFMDAIEMGMDVPSVHDIEAKAEECKMTAVAHKKAGNLEGAKAALVQSKKLTAHATKLKSMLGHMEKRKGGSIVQYQEEDLEAMFQAHEKTTTQEAQPNIANRTTTPKEKTSDELKLEAVRLRDEKKIKEAGEVLKLYKVALKREQDAAELKARKELVSVIQKEIDYAQQQIHIFEYYQRYVDPESPMMTQWKEYASKCSNVSKLIMAKGTDAIKMGKKKGDLFHVRQTGEQHRQSDFNGLIADVVNLGGDPSDERLEINILSMDVKENTTLQKLLKKQKKENLPQHRSTVRIEVELQLPPNEHDTEGHIKLVYEASSDALKNLELTTEGQESLPSSFAFENSQYVELERGNSAYGKILRRRIERNKRITLSAYHVPLAEKKGWLWSKKTNADELPPPTLLGKVVIELQGLLTRKCIAAGDFPLMNGSGTKELGGSIRLAVRTGLPLGASGEQEAGDADLPATVLEKYESMVFALNKEQPDAISG
jgi:hypothetical protein